MADTESDSEFSERQLRLASAAIAQGHSDPENLRELLICTTSTITHDMVEQYFRQHHQDKELLRALVSIALEGEDAGDAPWAAANTIADFPASMIAEHRAALLELSRHEWTYLQVPAQEALAKIDSSS